MSVTVEQETAIRHWLRLKKERDALVIEEMEARKHVTQLLFPKPSLGTQRFELGGGYKVKLVHKVNYKIDADEVENVLDQIEKVGPEGVVLARRLVKHSYDLSLSEYKKLDMAQPEEKRIKGLIDKIVTTSDASPTLEFEEPTPKA